MKKLDIFINKINIKKIIGNKNKKFYGLCINSLEAKSGFIFFAISGLNTKGELFIEEVIKKGVQIIVCKKVPKIINYNVTYIIVNNVTITLGIISSIYYNNPSNSLKLIGITGTNGKTTVATLLYNLFRKLGYKVVLISTIIIKINNKKIESKRTTPNIIEINKYLNNAVKCGCEYGFMEVSSHGIKQKRIYGLNFIGGVFTNITHDHLDYHKTFRNYLLTKKKFFTKYLDKNSFSLFNIDDKNYHFISKNTKSKIYTYSLIEKNVDFRAQILENSIEGSKILIDKYEFWTPLVGKFNIYNILSVYSVSEILGVNPINSLKIISNLKSVNGRFEKIFINNNQTCIVIDYAHTPDALNNIFYSILEFKKKKNIICVIGCGGDRDKKKRPIIANIAFENSNKVILTSDNPRYEDPKKIIEDMENGLNINNYKFFRILNRESAIKAAIKMANPKDIVLILGKGHEKFQEIMGVKQKFNDVDIVKKIIKYIK